jgi:hypothetical protein
VCHGNFLSFGDRAGIPLPLTSQCTQYDSTRIPFIVTPKALTIRIAAYERRKQNV